MKILIVGMCDSIHLAKWLTQFSDSQHTFRIVPSSPHRSIHPKLNELLRSHKFSMSWFLKFFSLFLWVLDRLLSDYLRGFILAKEIASFRPDTVHVLELQNAGYAYLRARQLLQSRHSHKLLITLYGSDIFWYQQFPNHLKKIKKILSLAHGLSSECRRDELLAEKHGFTGQFLPRIPAFGFINLVPPSKDRSQRFSIAVKGYQNKWGQALVAINALRKIANDLKGMTIEVYSAEGATIPAAKRLARESGLRVIIHKKHKLTNQEVLDLFSRSQIYIGLSKSDGISASMIEAMSRGAIPVQSDTSCCGEWLDDNVGGYLVKYNDSNRVARLVSELIKNQDFQYRAAYHNYQSLEGKLGEDKVHQAAIDTYALLRDGKS